MIRVCVAGATGWTGSAVADAVRAADGLELVAAISREPVRDTLQATPADVMVDYTHASVVKGNVLAALGERTNVVIGSSGLTADDYAEIDERAREAGVGVIAAGNFSVGAALLLRFAEQAAQHLGSWEVIDYAYDGKQDAPSGTSRELAERLDAPQLKVPLEETLGAREARGATIGRTQVHSLRLPSFTVSTEVVFAGPGERLSLRHDAGESATPYVTGTLLAIRAVVGRVGLTRGLDSLL